MAEKCCERDHDNDGNCDRHPPVGSRNFVRLAAFNHNEPLSPEAIEQLKKMRENPNTPRHLGDELVELSEEDLARMLENYDPNNKGKKISYGKKGT